MSGLEVVMVMLKTIEQNVFLISERSSYDQKNNNSWYQKKNEEGHASCM